MDLFLLFSVVWKIVFSILKSGFANDYIACIKKQQQYNAIKESIQLLILFHSSKIRGLCLMKLSSETFQKLYFWKIKKNTNHIVFLFILHFLQLWICNSGLD